MGRPLRRRGKCSGEAAGRREEGRGEGCVGERGKGNRMEGKVERNTRGRNNNKWEKKKHAYKLTKKL